MEILTLKQFRENQKAALDKVDKGEQIVITRGNKSYLIIPITETDKIILNPNTVVRIKESITQIEKGEYKKI